MFEIRKEFHFSASHQLDHLPDGHQCARLHGHNYIVVIGYRSASLDERGFVIDYGDLAPLKRFIDETLDHRHLNEVLGGGIFTTAENLARHIFEATSLLKLPTPAYVEVSETPKTWARFDPEYSS